MKMRFHNKRFQIIFIFLTINKRKQKIYQTQMKVTQNILKKANTIQEKSKILAQ